MLCYCPQGKSFLSFSVCVSIACFTNALGMHWMPSLPFCCLLPRCTHIPHFIPNNTVTWCSLCPPFSLTRIFAFQHQITDVSGFTCSQAVTCQQNQLLRPHRLSLLAIWQNRDNPGQRSNKMEECTCIWDTTNVAICYYNYRRYGSTKPTGLQFELKNSRLQPIFLKAQTTYSFLYIHIHILKHFWLYIF